MSRPRGKSLDSFYNRVHRPSCTLNTILQFLGSASLVQACWITAYNAFTRLGPPFFNSSAAIESTLAALLFYRYFSAPSISSRLGKSMSTPSSLKSTGRVGCFNLEPTFKCSFHLASTWFLLVNSSPFLARHIATCGLNGRLTSYKDAQSRLKPLRRAALLFF
jgi:hypothetical protein